ncbi:sensor histidine kinase [Streptoalloteichus hindustanus]|uniref:histidine kinase n=1 Tax=Streptoalloteichus hindustanus TaxID=2017 RepID=A0A1M5D2A2_STRHI|nr:sensor histidine kinase [Streptoalloteichus hindustanus]SHF60967.1 Signal transduction histidine kinase [Streptoalloteichus hindustanus]
MHAEQTWRPLRSLASARPWRCLAYLASGVPVGVLCLVVIAVLGGAGVLLLPVLVGVVPLVLLCLLGAPVARVERARLRWVDPAPVVAGDRAPASDALRRARARLREPATWREFAHALLLATVLWPVDLLVVATAVLPVVALLAPLLVAVLPADAVPAGKVLADNGLLWMTVPVGLVALVAAVPVVTLVGLGRARLARALLSTHRATDTTELVEVRRSRARMVDRHEAERRRIERDLHDGAQQRLTSVAMLLGLARAQLGPQHPVTGLVGKAHTEVSAALAELRDLIHGIHPRILADRGLDAALGELADRCAVPVRVDATVGGRLPDSVESAAYYGVSEALTNVVKHSGARRAEVRARYEGGVLRVEVRDDGRGGADPSRGGGLTGLADRAAAVGGTLALASPEGGPTRLRATIPCEPAP